MPAVSFVPLLPSSLVQSTADRSQSFIPASFLPDAQTHVHGNVSGQPLVRVIKEDDKVVRIHIECVCGQVIDLDCVT
jgi:hypothetical protein